MSYTLKDFAREYHSKKTLETFIWGIYSGAKLEDDGVELLGVLIFLNQKGPCLCIHKEGHLDDTDAFISAMEREVWGEGDGDEEDYPEFCLMREDETEELKALAPLARRLRKYDNEIKKKLEKGE